MIAKIMNLSADKLIAVGMVIALFTTIISADIIAITTGDMTIAGLGKEILIGLFGYMSRSTVQNLQAQEQSKTGEALGQIANTATQAQSIVNAIENIKDIVKK